jgi:hypothetical protein
MEGNFINRQGTKKDIKIWEDKDSFKNNALYDILDNNE